MRNSALHRKESILPKFRGQNKGAVQDSQVFHLIGVLVVIAIIAFWPACYCRL